MDQLDKRLTIFTLLSILASFQLLWLFSVQHAFSEIILLLLAGAQFTLFSSLSFIDDLDDLQSFNFRMRIAIVIQLLAFILLL